MSDYKKMYYKMFNKITDIIEELKELQLETEEIYIETSHDGPKDEKKIEKRES